MSLPRLKFLFGFLLLAGLMVSTARPISAAPQNMEELKEAMQQIEKSPMPDAAKQKARQEIMKKMAEARKNGGKPGEKKPDEKKDDKDKKDDKGKKAEEKKSDTIKRSDRPKKDADPKELEAKPTDGKLVLNFQGHPWPAMIDWYSRVTGREIEWQELPNREVNLRTQNAMTMEQTGDLLNRLLLAQGFTMLDDGDFMQIVKTEGINPAFVPRVDSRQLGSLPAHGFVRTSFMLYRFKADEIVKELEAMKSKHGKLTPMTAANRIEAMDMVRNLRDIYRALDEEETSGHHKPREFVVKYVRAQDIKDKIGEMLGLESKQPAGKMSPQQMQQMMQRRQQEMQRQAQQKKNGGGQPAPKEEKISMIVNEMKNSIIIKAPPHRMLDIADAIDLLDVRPDSNSLDIKAYTLATRSPQEVADMLEESGALSPTCMVRVDKNTKTLLVSGNQFDHFRIEELIKNIDGNARRFVSIRLRRYPAAQVAGTIEKMMGEPEEDNNSRRRYYWWDDDEEEDSNDTFKVTADVENNRLILKCNDSEYEMVMELLTQMGEVQSRSKFAMNEIVLDEIAVGVEEDDLLRRVKQAFEAYAPNSVVLPPPKEVEPEDDVEIIVEPADSEEETDAVDIGSRTTFIQPALPTFAETATETQIQATTPTKTMFTQVRVAEAPKNDGGGGSQSPPPIVIERNAQGKLVIKSQDPAALEMFEELLRQYAPKNEDWVSFRLKNVTALWMRLQLEDFFEDDEGGPNYVFWDYWDYQRSKGDKSTPGLGEAPKMRFIDDGDSTLVVRNASAKQLATVKRLIELYDVAEPPNENSARYKKMIPIVHSKARVIETALKEAFRDLLSSNDKAFADQNKGEGDKGGSRRFGFGFGMGSDQSSGLGSGSNFKGKLSFGVDESTNTLIVTAQGRPLLDLVVEMVEELDKAAAPTDDTRVQTLPNGLNAQSVREALTRMFGDQVTTQQKGKNKEGKEGEGKENGRPNRGGGGGEGRPPR